MITCTPGPASRQGRTSNSPRLQPWVTAPMRKSPGKGETPLPHNLANLLIHVIFSTKDRRSSYGPVVLKPKTRAISHVRTKKSYTPSFQALTSTHRHQTNRKTEPRLLQCEQKSGASATGDNKTWGHAAWRTLPACRVAIRSASKAVRLFEWRHIFARVCWKPLSAPDQRISQGKKVQEFRQKAHFVMESDARPRGTITTSH